MVVCRQLAHGVTNPRDHNSTGFRLRRTNWSNTNDLDAIMYSNSFPTYSVSGQPCLATDGGCHVQHEQVPSLFATGVKSQLRHRVPLDHTTSLYEFLYELALVPLQAIPLQAPSNAWPYLQSCCRPVLMLCFLRNARLKRIKTRY